MKEKSHRAPRRCYRSGVWTLNGTQTWRLDGHSLYSAPRLPGPRDFEADHRHIRPAAGQFRRRRHSAEADRRPARPDLAIGRRHPRPSATRQGGAPASGFAAPARLRAGLWLRRLQRRRPADRRPDPQAAARPRSARRRGLGIAAHAVAVRKRRGPRRPLSARDGVGRRRADLPPRAPGRRGPAHHDRSRCDGRPDARSAGVCPLQRVLRHLVLPASRRHGDVQPRTHPARRGRAAAAGHRGGDPARMRARSTGETATLYGETRYAARRWDRKRRIIMKAEVLCYPGRSRKDNPRFLVTNLPHRPATVYTRLYCGRGDMENRLKELQQGVAMDRTSCSRFVANQLRLLCSVAAYVLFQALQTFARAAGLGAAQVWTLRERLVKVAVWVERSVRRIVLHLPHAFPWRDTWHKLAQALTAT